jgi:signal transduction histidine kinase/ActR/RegA family two-component response regulator
MALAQADHPPPAADASHRAVDFVHGLLSRPAGDRQALDGLLGELAAAFEATGAGLAALPEGRVLLRQAPDAVAGPWPWHDDPDLATRIRQSCLALCAPRPGGGSLVLTVVDAPDGGWLVWVEDGPDRTWSAGEAAALTLAGHVLGRWLKGPEPAPRWARQVDRAARRQRLEQAAAVARRLAHDFGNVLTSILGFAELALAQPRSSDGALQTYLSELHKGAQCGADLTRVLRTFARRQAVPTRSATVGPVLAEEEVRLRQAAGPDVQVEVSVAAELPAVGLDGEHLREVLAEVLNNAREAVGSSGGGGPREITVTARAVTLDAADCLDLYGEARPGPFVEIVVADNGPGLSPEARRGLFAEPFFSTRSRRRGFGLASAYGVLCAHRGGLDVAGRPGGGTEVRLLIPVAVVPTAPVTAAAPGVVRGERVLVVDDDAMLLQFVTRTLERAGYRVLGAATPDEALRAYSLAEADPFRLVLTDVVMPGLSGVELAHRLLNRGGDVAIVFMSGQVSLDYLQQTFRGATFEVLAKPFRPDALLRTIRAALHRPDAPTIVRPPERQKLVQDSQ